MKPPKFNAILTANQISCYLGHSDQGRVLYVVTVEETENHTRILSARKAESHEREKYEKRF